MPALEIAPDLIEAGPREAVFQLEILPLDSGGAVGGDLRAEIDDPLANGGRFVPMHNCT